MKIKGMNIHKCSRFTIKISDEHLLR